MAFTRTLLAVSMVCFLTVGGMVFAQEDEKMYGFVEAAKLTVPSPAPLMAPADSPNAPATSPATPKSKTKKKPSSPSSAPAPSPSSESPDVADRSITANGALSKWSSMAVALKAWSAFLVGIVFVL